MRPVLLDVAGFASFRDRAVVDFADADYFALVGPTGSGKSTIIDAMTFALYGSAPRWGKSNAIADALAPTSNRCTVKLVFDVGEARYVVAREVRRSGKAVQQKNVILEKLADRTGVGAEGEASEVLAGDLREVTRAVETLLGLSFSDFCQCIVLPQGQFADFLRATPRDRQEILLKLLGADQYESIREAANQRAAIAQERVLVLDAQLGGLAGVSPAALAAARAQESALADLAGEVATELPALQAAAAAVAEADELLKRLTRERDLLAGVTRPAGVADLQAAVDRAGRTHRATVDAELAAVEADGAARLALAGGPARSALELVLERLAERDLLLARRPAVEAEDTAAGERERAARTTEDDASLALGAARDRRDQTRAELAAAEGRLADLRQRRSDLAQVRAPAGVAQVGARHAAAQAAWTGATAARAAAEDADEQARSAAAGAPGRGPLEQALADLGRRSQAQQRLAELTGAQADRAAELAGADDRLVAAREALAAARAGQEKAITAEAAAHLRPHLVAGEPCPVCDQPVTSLPQPLDLGALAEAAAAVQAADGELSAAQAAQASCSLAEAELAAAIRASRAEIDRLAAAIAVALAGYPGLAGIGDSVETAAGSWNAELERIDGLAEQVRSAGLALKQARAAERTAQRGLAALEAELASAWTRLRAAHGPLIAAGAPELSEADLPAAWAALTGWAVERIAELDAGPGPAATAAFEAATRAETAAESALSAALVTHRSAAAGLTAALRAAERAAAARRGLADRLASLDEQLEGAPTAEQVRAQLEVCASLETAAFAAGEQLQAARSALRAAEQGRAGAEQRAGRARRELRAARDSLVPLGAPALDEDLGSDLSTDGNLAAGRGLAGGWRALLEWAAREVSDRESRLPAVLNRRAAAAEASDQRYRALLELVRERGISVPDGAPAGHLPTLVAAGHERARAEAARIADQLERAATLGAELDAAREQQQVARMLGNLLRSDQFPRWLASAALDTLVTDASATLYELSGRQFHLAHERGDFMVIDHTDADSRRSVRTLSGGETFQASLALALALSAQLSTLAAAGAARLDSIFLDEGFGTLDPETLEVVAETLENLARGERMVGVITHVAALAERAPVRFAVQRDGRTSSVVREGAA